MVNENGNIEFDQLAAYLLGESNEQEIALVEEWISMSEENRKELESCKKLLALDFNEDGNDMTDQMGHQFNVDKAWDMISNEIIDSSASGIVRTLPGTENESIINKRNTAFTWIGIAASVLLAGFLTIYFLGNLNSGQTEYSFEDGIHEIFLPDSSKVVLQPQTTISFTREFNQSSRPVTLEGVAYFDVVRDENREFSINTSHGKITVLGTAFTVEETPEALIVEVERGTVKLQASADENNSVILNRNERAQLFFQDNLIEKTELTNVNHLFWANKRLTYRRTALKQVLDELAISYSKNITYDSQIISGCQISAVFKEQTFEDILRSISISLDFEYTIDGDDVEIISNGCQSN